MEWFRWYHGTVNDPKWRVIARKSCTNVRDVMAVFACFLERASQSNPRGSIDGWDVDDIAACLDLENHVINAIYEAMQGKVLDCNKLSGWDKRQPKREDGSSERAKAWRERNRTQPNANERTRTQMNTDRAEQIEQNREEKKDKLPPKSPKGDVTEFDEFWAVYPRKTAKTAALHSYVKAIKRVSHDVLMSGVRGYAAKCEGKDQEFIAHASTWLNQSRWEDFVGQEKSEAPNPYQYMIDEAERANFGVRGLPRFKNV